MKGRQTEQVRDVVDILLKKLERGSVKKASKVKEAWKKSVEASGLGKTRPVSIKKGVLVVLVENTSWLYRLTLEKHNILKRFNEEYPSRNKIRDIRFRVGELDS